MPERQSTLGEVAALYYVEHLNMTQLRALRLVVGGLTQSQAADRVGVSRQYVNRLIVKLKILGLLKEQNGSKVNKVWQAAPVLRRHLENMGARLELTLFPPHNVRMHYKVDLDRDPVITPRTGHFRSWQMRGGTRHLFTFPGRPGYPGVTLELHPGAIVAYPTKGERVPAGSIEEAEKVTFAAIHDAVRLWQERQAWYGVRAEITDGPRQCTRPHYGALFRRDSPIAAEQTSLKDWWIDKSPAAHGMPEYSEIETYDRAAATALDEGIRKVLNIEDVIRGVVPEAMREFMDTTFAPQVETIRVLQHGGTTLQQQVNNLVQVCAMLMKRQNTLEDIIIQLSGAEGAALCDSAGLAGSGVTITSHAKQAPSMAFYGGLLRGDPGNRGITRGEK